MNTYELVKFCNPWLYRETVERASMASIESRMNNEQAAVAESQMMEQALASLRTQEGNYKITRVSPISQEKHTLEIAILPEQIVMWLGGKLIQGAMPDLSADQREFLMTGITKEEWDEMFKKDEE